MATLGFPGNPQIGDTYSVGSRTWIWTGQGWKIDSTQSSPSFNSLSVGQLFVTTSTNSTSTTTGGVVITGGAGIRKDLWVGGTIYSANSEVVTTATIGNLAGSLQAVTDRGNSTTNAIIITNATESTTATDGALVVTGGVGIGGNLNVTGDITARKLTIEFTTVTTTIVETDDIIVTNNLTNAVNTFTGALRVAGGAAVGNDLWVENTVYSNAIRIGNDGTTPSQFNNDVKVAATTSATDRYTGAFVVSGGVGIAGDLYVGGIYSNGNQVLTSACGSPSFVSRILAGVDISINTESGVVTINDISTLESVTSRGSSSTYEISINNYTGSTDTNTGALVVRGGVGIGENLNVFGAITGSNLQIYGLPGSTSTINGILSVNTLRITGGVNTFCTATGSLQICGGIAVQGNVFSTGNVYANGYLVNTGTFSGGTLSSKTTITSTETSTSTNTGALQVVGGVGIGLDVYVGRSVNADYFNAYGSNTSSTFAGPVQFNNTVTVTSTTESESTDSGAVLVTGGVGIGGNLNVGGTVTAPEFNGYFSGTISATGTVTTASCATNIIGGQAGAILYQTDVGLTGFITTASEGQILVSGGAGTPVYQNTLTLTGVTSSDSTDTGALVVSGGVGIGSNLNVGGRISGASLNLPSASEVSTITGTLNVGIANITFPLAAYSTDSGAFTVVGGIGIGGDVYIGGTLFVDRALAITTSTICSAAVTSIIGGTDTAVSTSTGAVVIWNTSNLQSVTDRGSSTTNAILITNTEESTLTTTGALVVGGGVGIGGNLNVNKLLTLNPVPWNYVETTFTSVLVTYGETRLTFTVQPDNSITNMSVAVGAGGYGPPSVNLTIPGTTFPGGTSPANDIVFNVETFESPGPVNSTAVNSAVSYVSGILPQRYDNIYSTGSVGIGAGEKHWVFGTDGKLTAPGNVIVRSTESSISTTTGALTVTGGVGVGGDVYVGGNLNVTGAIVGGALVVTTASIASQAATSITAGTDTAVSTSTGAITIWNTSTLQTVTGRGNSTTNIIVISNVTESTSTDTGALQVAGGAGIGGTLNVGQGINVLGSSEIVGGNGLGYTLRVRGGTGAQYAFGTGQTGLNTDALNSTGTAYRSYWFGASDFRFNIYSGDEPGSVVQNQALSISTSGFVTISSLENAISTQSGALQVAGGVGIGGNLYVGGEIFAQKLTIEYTTVTTTIVETDDIIRTSNVTSATNTETGALQIAGGAGIGGTVWIGGDLNVKGTAYLNNAQVLTTQSGLSSILGTSVINQRLLIASGSNSTSTNTGALIVEGGVGIGKDVYIGGIVNSINTTNSTSTDSGALILAGGVGIAQDMYVGGTIYSSGSQVLTFANTASLVSSSAGFASTSGFALSFNTGTLVNIAVSATTSTFATTSGYALNFNTGTLVNIAVYASSSTYAMVAGVADSLGTGTYTIVNNTNSTSTDTGALTVVGGVGIGGTVNVGERIFINGAEVLTTSSVNQFANQTTIYAGTDTAVSGNTGTITIWNTSTLQTVSDRGNSTTNSILITNVTDSAGTDSGALQVVGGGGIGGNLYVGGDLYQRGAKVVTTSTVQSLSTSTLAGVTQYGATTPDAVRITNTSSSTSIVTGALVVDGGVGIGGNVNIGGGLVASGINLLNQNQHIWYVDPVIGVNDYTKNGHPLAPARTIKYILGYADDGDTVFIQPGIYYEEFPLTVAKGVNVRGAGLREVTIYPTTATNTATAFLLMGESLISDFTVGGFFKPGYAFEFAPGAVTTTKSPYIERFSVITKGSVTSAGDPYGFDANNAGGGVKIDGARVATTSAQASMMFNEATFIVPNATGLYMTNGARAEVINTFFYFADKAIHAVTSSTGYAGAGKTKLKLGGISGTLSVGDTLFYKTSGGTTLASGTIASVDGSYVYITGAQWGFDTPSTRTAKIISVLGDVSVDTSVKKYGTGSAKFDGVGDGLTIPSSSDFGFGTGDFTIEGWFYHISNATQDMFEFRVNGTSQAAISLSYSSSNLVLTVLGSARITGTSALPSNNTWYHVVLMRASGNTMLYVNGAQVGSTWADSTNYITAPLFIGTRYDNTIPWNGYIDDIRISKGIAKYSTSSFVTPTQALTTDEYTVLMLHANGALGSTVFTDDNVTPQVIYSTGTTYASATSIELADYHQFGAEIRSLGSAAIFGNTGITADGTGTDIKLIGFNLSHIGSGKDSTDDISLVVQSNEIIQLNNGRVYFQTVDQSGDFRVGNSFLVNQKTGDVSFGDAKVNLSNVSQLTITDGVNSSVILPTSVSVGSLVLSGGSLVTHSGDLTLDPAGVLTTINSNLQVNGSVNIASTSYIGTGTILTTIDLQTVTHTATYITNDIGTVPGLSALAGTTSTIYGTYNFGTVSDIWTFNDFNTGTNFGFYSINDASGAPGFIVYIGFSGITDFNRIVLNINYTQNSGHTQQIELYNYVQNQWDTFTTYSGSTGWFEFILGTIDPAPYISSGNVTARINHVSTGNTAHRTWIDYVVLEKSIQGGQGPRGATGATGPTGSQGATTSTTSTFVFFNTTNSTSTNSGAVTVYGGVGIGGNLYVGGDISVGGSLLVTTSSITSYVTPTVLTAGTDTAVSTSTGNITIWNTSTLQTVTGRGNSTTNVILILNATSATSTNSGALQVSGGAGIGQDLYVGGALYQQGQQVLTTASVNQFANQTSITAGTDTAVSTSTGAIIIWNTSTLETVTGRGATTNNAISVTNATSSTSTATGALQVVGGVGIGGNLYVGGEIVAQKLTIQLTTVTTTEVTTDDIISTYNTTNATSTNSGALQVAGGAGIGGNLYVGSTIYSSGNVVLTTATVNQFANQTSISAGVGISVNTSSGNVIITNIGVTTATGSTYIGISTSSGNVLITNLGVTNLSSGTDITLSATTGSITINNVSTLQSITGRGATTTNVVSFTNTTTSTSTATGAVVITGGLGVGGQINATSIVAGGVRSTTSSTPPANPFVGDMWYNTTNDRLYRYTANGVVNFWLDYTGPVVQYLTSF
jgi:hypothetical protein